MTKAEKEEMLSEVKQWTVENMEEEDLEQVLMEPEEAIRVFLTALFRNQPLF